LQNINRQVPQYAKDQCAHRRLLKKRELEAAADCMTWEERNIWQQKLDALDAEDKAMSSRNMDTAAGVTALSDEGDKGAV
jgi:hypothetical protein